MWYHSNHHVWHFFHLERSSILPGIPDLFNSSGLLTNDLDVAMFEVDFGLWEDECKYVYITFSIGKGFDCPFLTCKSWVIGVVLGTRQGASFPS